MALPDQVMALIYTVHAVEGGVRRLGVGARRTAAPYPAGSNSDPSLVEKLTIRTTKVLELEKLSLLQIMPTAAPPTLDPTYSTAPKPPPP